MALIWLFVLIFSFCYRSSAEVVAVLPGQPGNVSFKQYSGYITTDAQHGRALFYYFVEAESANPFSHPLTLWLNGGPGCSSVGFGAFMEHGPFQPGDNGLLVKNEYSWNLESNMLYVESPIGTLEFFLTGESYAGHYIPQLAALLMEYNRNSNIKPIKLKSIALGNPLLDIDMISVEAGDYLRAHGVISDIETLVLEETVCNNSKYLREYVHDQWSQGCNDVFNIVSDEISEDVATDDLLLPKCLSSTSAEQFRITGKHAGKTHAAVTRRRRIFTHLNKPHVQKALHANTTHLPFHWDFYILIKAGIPIMLYSGDQDSKIPLTQTRIIASNLAKDLKLVPFTKYGPWYDKKQVRGRMVAIIWWVMDGKNVTYLTYATVRSAAHEVPFTSPSQALTLFRPFLKRVPLHRPSE
ncbi:hypothetical protein I3843_04G018700 [Carya illinoinensis]|nr:hypothetical protein I3843_04G018700 [Carya illinoinensis]